MQTMNKAGIAPALFILDGAACVHYEQDAPRNVSANGSAQHDRIEA
jgi:hypothetical protein